MYLASMPVEKVTTCHLDQAVGQGAIAVQVRRAHGKTVSKQAKSWQRSKSGVLRVGRVPNLGNDVPLVLNRYLNWSSIEIDQTVRDRLRHRLILKEELC